MDLQLIETSKKAAAYMAVDNHIKDNFSIGIGSGSTIVYAVTRLAERVREGIHIKACIPTSFQARQLIIENNLPLSDLERTSELDVAIDGADDTDRNLCLIKGGGGCLLQEKVVAAAAKEFVVIADDRKLSNELGDHFPRIPIEVIPLAYKLVQERIVRELGGEVKLRNAIAKAGPVVTDNSNFILDWSFPKNITECFSWEDVNIKLKMIPGVVETGLFVNMTNIVYFGTATGDVKVIEANH